MPLSIVILSAPWTSHSNFTELPSSILDGSAVKTSTPGLGITAGFVGAVQGRVAEQATKSNAAALKNPKIMTLFIY
jgi:hypothetical protein